ncbi:MAG: hypothetical protein ACR2N6_00985 [Miltoncostaeaceae bacterium]
MYEHSRSLYRELKPYLLPDRPGSATMRRSLLGACEGTLVQLASDKPPAAPVKQLFTAVRGLVPAQHQMGVFSIIDQRVTGLAAELERRREIAGGSLLRCAANNRRGLPCGREPLQGSRYCPSHQQQAAA